VALIGRGIKKDPGVLLNVMPGRKIAKLKGLKLGAQARLRSGSVLYAHSVIGDHFETGHNVVIREENQIGEHVSIWNNTTVDYGCQIGSRVKIHCGGYIAQYSILEDDVFLAPGVIFANDLFPGASDAAKAMQGPILRKGAQIGVNATLLPGVVIGENAIIGSGSVVTRDVPAGSVAWGNPARVYKRRADLRWPQRYSPVREEAAFHYKRFLAGNKVF
jgi:acetyltransferase-like isoleucine patch superfamily enzyme